MRSLILLALLPSTLAAQAAGALHVEGVGEPVTVQAAMHRGYPAFPAWTLRAVGARVDETPRGTRVVLGDDTLAFAAGSPFFHAGAGAWQLVAPAYSEGGVFYLPHQLFAEWLPSHFADRLEFDRGRLRLRGAARVAAEPADAASSAVESDAAAPPDEPAPAGRPEPLGEPAPTPLVVIDAGHGGVDPGRIGPSGLKEKDVVLQVSKRLARVLTERGYEVRLTRTADTLIALGDRPHMANEWRGSRPGMFLSIHANGVSDRRAVGFETFFLSDARTEDERRVAEMENAAVAYEENSRVVGADDLDFILNHLRNDYYIRASHTLAGLIQDEMEPIHPGPNRGVKQAGFRVLVGAFMPAVLVELAFLSNPAEERLLGSGRFQVQAAEGIADAVDRFFESQAGLWSGASP